ncbi:PREDICTED: agglutinin-2-like [Nelumbo nucifera]|uniref:Agglutinin-2-like n=1 Tax=Nelumbo nucifera TaxID=4432 RepID=A0A1U7Z6D0_NELNU|nr:PREDICTED: agglutinin-2-like [Nelumbo nucifera]
MALCNSRHLHVEPLVFRLWFSFSSTLSSMALCNSRHLYVEPPNYLSDQFHMLVLLLLLVIPSATPISFNFSSFNPNMREIQYEGSAYVSDQLIQLTPNQFDKGLPYFTVGRAKYWQPVHLWDKSTRKLTDFTTNFNFTMLSQNRTFGADGLAFFLAPEGSKLPPNSSGRSLGLFDKKFEFNSTENYSIVAVEFDTFKNNFDPSHDHIGIDINSIVSVTNVSWPGPGSMKDGRLAQARISYNSTSTNLSVSLTYPNDPASSGIKASLSYVVDLRDYLPEQVTVGFSAATGESSELHTIYSWEFSSSLETGKKNKAVGLVVGLVVGGGALIAAGILIMVISFVLCRKRSGDEDDDDGAIDLAIDEEFEKGAGPKRFSYKELVRATNNFNEEGKLGQGGFGAVYRGFLKDLNLDVAVKRVSRGSKQGIKEYISEVKIIDSGFERPLPGKDVCSDGRAWLALWPDAEGEVAIGPEALKGTVVGTSTEKLDAALAVGRVETTETVAFEFA